LLKEEKLGIQFVRRLNSACMLLANLVTVNLLPRSVPFSSGVFNALGLLAVGLSPAMECLTSMTFVVFIRDG
jgi:hypothetical protein